MKKFRRNDFTKQTAINKYITILFLLISTFVTTYCIAYADGVIGGVINGNLTYNPEGLAYISVVEPNGRESCMKLNFKFAGSNSKLQNPGNYRDVFEKQSRPVTVSAVEYSGNLQLGIEGNNRHDTSQKKWTGLNTANKYSIISFNISYKQPAHSVYGGQQKNDNTMGRFHVTNSANASHQSYDHWVTLPVEINLSNTGMITDGKGAWHVIILTINLKYNGTYTVTLNNNVNSSSNSYTKVCGDTITLPNPTLAGYSFLGWYDGNTRYDGGSTYTVCSRNATVTAQWAAQSHYVTFDTQGGTFPSSLKSQTELDGCKIIPNGIYSIKSNCGSNKYIHVYGAGYNKTPDNGTAICIYGTKGASQTQWVVERYKNTQYYTITSYHNGLALSLAGSPTNNQPGTGQQGRQLELWSMEKDIIDYQWYFKENNGHLEIYNRSKNQCLDVKSAGTTDGTPIQQYNPNHSYAQWWDFEPVVQTDYPFKLQYADYNLLTPSISPQRGSDKFLGWSTDKNATSPTYYANSVCNIYGNSNVTLYAIYQARATVSYDANGGSNASLPKPKVVDVGSKITLASAGTMGRDNYVFLGWSTDPHATKNYDPADSEVTVNSSGNVVYYAIWKNATGNADLSNVITGDGMFTNDTELEGQNGTTYNSIHDGLDYAKPDGGVDEPGYYIEK